MILIACFFFNWKKAALLALAGLAIKYYIRSTELYTNQQRPRLTAAQEEEANVARWQRKIQCQLYYSCFVLGDTELNVVGNIDKELAQKPVRVYIGDEHSDYPPLFLMKIPFFHSLLLGKWRELEKDEIHLSNLFPCNHTELKRLQKLHEKAALIPGNLDTDFLCLDNSAFLKGDPEDSSTRLRMVESDAYKDCEFMDFYFPQSIPNNFRKYPPINKVPSCQFNLLPPAPIIENVNESADVVTRQKNVIECLNTLKKLPKTHRFYYSNKVINEFMASLHSDLTHNAGAFNPWQKLQQVLDQCKELQEYITVLDFSSYFKFDEQAWKFLKQFPNLLWLQVDNFGKFCNPTEIYSSIRVVNMEIGQELSHELTDELTNKIFPNADVIEIS